MIDLRSDTVTRPTPAMLQAMVSAPLGDDVMGDDPTVIQLQAAVAERAGKAAGLFFPSGTQSNLAALMAHCDRGDEYLVGQLAHTYKYEGGGAAVLGSIQPQPIEHAEDGSLPLEKLAAAVKPQGDPHFARTRLLALENTFHGKLIPAGYIQAATDWARKEGLATHLDGARVFNAAVASGKPLADMCQPFDSVSICFSKGLGAPVGSVLVGSAELIGRGIAGVKVLSQDTNMLFVEFQPSRCDALTEALGKEGILMRAVYGGPTRLVTHLDVSADDVQRVVQAVARHLA